MRNNWNAIIGVAFFYELENIVDCVFDESYHGGELKSFVKTQILDTVTRIFYFPSPFMATTGNVSLPALIPSISYCTLFSRLFLCNR